MPQQVVHRTTAGLYAQHNPVNQVPEGALAEAENVSVDREGIVGSRRGFSRYGAGLSTAPQSFGEFKDTLIFHQGTAVKRDLGSGTWGSWAGTYSAPSATARMRFNEVRDNLYFNTSDGVYKNDALANNPVRAGMPQGLDVKTSKVGDGTGWLGIDVRVGYRIVWGRKDANDYLILGAPSLQEVVTNATSSVVLDWGGGVALVEQVGHGYTTGDLVVISGTSASYDGSHTISVLDADHYTYELATAPGDVEDDTGAAGKAFNVTLVTTIPDDVVAGDFYEVYRTEVSASATTAPGDRHFKILRVDVTSADITAGTVTFQDTYSEAFLGDELYTNPTQQTISQANDKPPWCADFAVWKSYPWYANVIREHELEVQLLSVASLVDATITITSTGESALIYTGKAAEDIGAQEFQVYSAESTTAENLRETAKSLVRVINRDTSNTAYYAIYTSLESDPPGKITIRKRLANQTSFTVSSSVGTSWSPDLTSSQTSEAYTGGNTLHRGKFEQVEAVPRLSGRLSVGSEKYEIKRILPLRDSLIILKEDGVWRVSGESETSFSVKQLDPSSWILAPESAVVLDNSVYALTNQGVVKVSESGTAIVSRQVETDLKKVLSFPNYATLTHAVAYESDRKYILFCQEDATKTSPNIAWVYNFLTQAWTQWRKPADAGYVLFSDDKLYLSHPTDFRVLQERKSYETSDNDYRDEAITVTVDSLATTTLSGRTVTTATVSYSYTGATLTSGFLLEQGNYSAGVESVTDLGGNSYVLTLDEYLSQLEATTCTLSIPIPIRLRWTPESMGITGAMKQCSVIQIYQEENSARHNSVGFLSNVDNNETILTVNVEPTQGWGDPEWGVVGWGDYPPDASTPLRVFVPRQYQRSAALSLIYRHAFAREKVSILNVTYTFRVANERTVRVPA